MKLKTALLTALLTFSTLTQASALSVLVNGQPLQSDVQPQIIAKRTFVPVSAVASATGASVSWEQSTKTVVIDKDGKNLRIPVGMLYATKNEESVILDAPAQIVNGRTMVPLSFIATNLDIPVSYDVTTKTVLLGDSQGSVAPQPAQEQTQQIYTYRVTRVIDGDTIEIDVNGKTEKVRLIGVDTPESVHPDESKNVPFGKVASEFTKNALEGKNIILEYDVTPRDKYGRILAYVWLDGKMFNKTLLENGMAQVKTYPPDVKYVDDFTKLQEAARSAKVGMWEGYLDSVTVQTGTPLPSLVNTVSVSTDVQTTDSTKEGVWIKGNKNSKIYHYPHGRDYNKISSKNIVWFETPAQAEAAGYRAAQQ